MTNGVDDTPTHPKTHTPYEAEKYLVASGLDYTIVHPVGEAEEVQADYICIVYRCVCYRGRRRCKLTVLYSVPRCVCYRGRRRYKLLTLA